MNKAREESSSAINTRKVAGRRMLRFESIDEALAEADRLVAAEKAGQLDALGNWTLGQALGHLAAWAEYSYDGSPTKPPFFIKWIARLMRRRFLYGPMPPGLKIPRVEGGTYAIDPMPVDEACSRLRRALKRLETEAPTIRNAMFGYITHEEWIAINLRHAELHLGFFVAL